MSMPSVPAEGWADASQATIDSYGMAAVADQMAAVGDWLAAQGDSHNAALNAAGIWIDGVFISYAAAQAATEAEVENFLDKYYRELEEFRKDFEEWLKDPVVKINTTIKDKQRSVDELLKAGVDRRLIDAMIDLEKAKTEIEEEMTKEAEGIWNFLTSGLANFGDLLVGLVNAGIMLFWEELEKRL